MLSRYGFRFEEKSDDDWIGYGTFYPSATVDMRKTPIAMTYYGDVESEAYGKLIGVYGNYISNTSVEEGLIYHTVIMNSKLLQPSFKWIRAYGYSLRCLKIKITPFAWSIFIYGAVCRLCPDDLPLTRRLLY